MQHWTQHRFIYYSIILCKLIITLIYRLMNSKLLSPLMANSHSLCSLTNVELFNKLRVELPLDSLLETTCIRITHCLGCLMWQPLPVTVPLNPGAMCSSESVKVWEWIISLACLFESQCTHLSLQLQQADGPTGSSWRIDCLIQQFYNHIWHTSNLQLQNIWIWTSWSHCEGLWHWWEVDWRGAQLSM